MRVSILFTALLAVLAGCKGVEELTGSNPIIDTKGVNMTQYDRDLSECQAYADEVEIARKAATGAVKGAVVGSVFGTIVGNGRVAQRGAGVGAVGGGARGVGDGLNERERVIRNCLVGRGYHVLN
jgi:outer membrane lipoprotein SlyB